MSLSIIILAAGFGKRMQSEYPKVLHKIGGKPILQYVVDTALTFTPNIYIVYGYGAELVREQLRALPVTWIPQQELLGTGHAVLQAIPHLSDDHRALILVGDCPFIKPDILKSLINETAQNEVGVITAKLSDPSGYGRIVKDQAGKVSAIIEEKDATTEQKQINEINSGIIIAPVRYLKEWLPRLKNQNAQGEYYLTDIISLAKQQKIDVKAALTSSNFEILGINNRVQLAQLERFYQQQMAEKIMMAGVTLLDPMRLDLRGNLQHEKDIIIDINVILEGEIAIGSHTFIGPNCIIKNTRIGRNVEIKANCVIEDAIIEDNCVIGPFARIRPEVQLCEGAHIGNFVEIKKSVIGKGSKVNHLSYIGDTSIGKNVNVGAGTITCNYDGANKHKTIIEDDVFIGSGTQLVAPIKISEGTTIGAGSTIIKNTPPGQLTLSRTKQETIAGWKRPKKKDK